MNWKKLDVDQNLLKVAEFEGEEALKVDVSLWNSTRSIPRDITFLRSSHLLQLQSILDDPEASSKSFVRWTY